VKRTRLKPPWKSWLRRVKRLVEVINEHPDIFKNWTIEWLERNQSQFNSLSGVVEWVEREERITPPLMVAIVNTERAVRNMIRYKKHKEEKHGQPEAPGGVERDQAQGPDS